MRAILVEQARRRKAARRGGGQLLVELEDAHATTRPREAELTAGVLAISPATVKREWASARAWLYDRVYGKG